MPAKKNKYEVVHPKFFFCVKGNLQHVPVGSVVLLSAAQAKKSGNRLKPCKEQKVINDGNDSDAKQD